MNAGGSPPPPKRARGEKHIAVDGIVLDVVDGDPTEYEDISTGALDRVLSRKNEPCWGCQHFCRPERPVDEPDLYRLWNYYDTNKGKTHDKNFVQMMHDMHKELIVDKRRDAGQEVLEWSAAMIDTHFKMHRFIPKSQLIDDIRDINTDIQTLKKQKWRKNLESGKLEPNEKNHKLYYDAVKLKYTLMAINPDKLFEV